jgi:hypothetical protein
MKLTKRMKESLLWALSKGFGGYEDSRLMGALMERGLVAKPAIHTYQLTELGKKTARELKNEN